MTDQYLRLLCFMHWIRSRFALIEIHVANNSGVVSFGRGQPGGCNGPGIDKSLDFEKSREEMTPYFLARLRKFNFHFSFYSRFSRLLEKILFLLSINEIIKPILFLFSIFKIFRKKFSFSFWLMRFRKTDLILFSIFKILRKFSPPLLNLWTIPFLFSNFNFF